MAFNHVAFAPRLRPASLPVSVAHATVDMAASARRISHCRLWLKGLFFPISSCVHAGNQVLSWSKDPLRLLLGGSHSPRHCVTLYNLAQPDEDKRTVLEEAQGKPAHLVRINLEQCTAYTTMDLRQRLGMVPSFPGGNRSANTPIR